MLMLMRCFAHPAAMIRQNARHMLELDCRMVNAEGAQRFIHAAEYVAASRTRHVLDQDMGTERMRSRAETPDVKVMNIKNTINLFHRVGDIGQAHPARKALEQNVERFAHDIAG